MKRAAARLTLALAALCVAATALADGNWPASVGSAQPAHYFGDVRPFAMPNRDLSLQLDPQS